MQQNSSSTKGRAFWKTKCLVWQAFLFIYTYIIIPSKYPLGMMGKKLNNSFLPGTLHWVMPLGSRVFPKQVPAHPGLGGHLFWECCADSRVLLYTLWLTLLTTIMEMENKQVYIMICYRECKISIRPFDDVSNKSFVQ